MKPAKLGLSLATGVAQLTTPNAWQLPFLVDRPA